MVSAFLMGVTDFDRVRERVVDSAVTPNSQLKISANDEMFEPLAMAA